MSTNDSVLFLASGASGVHPASEPASSSSAQALDAMLLRIALMMVADGEGATKIMRLSVRGADDDAQARNVSPGPSPTHRWSRPPCTGATPTGDRVISSAGAGHGRPFAAQGQSPSVRR